MKKYLTTLFIFFIIVCLLGGLSYFYVGNAIQKNRIVAESITEKKLPANYIVINAYSNSDKNLYSKSYASFALLKDDKNRLLMLVKGPEITSEEAIDNIRHLLKPYKNSKEMPDFESQTELTVNRQIFPIYEFSFHDQRKAFKGQASFLNRKQKTILFIMFVSRESFKDTLLKDFLHSMYSY